MTAYYNNDGDHAWVTVDHDAPTIEAAIVLVITETGTDAEDWQASSSEPTTFMVWTPRTWEAAHSIGELLSDGIDIAEFIEFCGEDGEFLEPCDPHDPGFVLHWTLERVVS